ncbi:MAG: zinc ribbon domain-containing protein [Clostridia bacterium]|nr:zinc ribbon domain-containing protein [Clostridia bacterium]
MALLNRLNRMARTIGDLANEALEASRENREREERATNQSMNEIDVQRAAAEEQFRRIGEHYYNVYISGGEVAGEIADACEAAKTHMDAIAAEEERIRIEEEERIRREAELAAQDEEASGIVCPGCGAAVAPGKRFCGECGTKIELPKARHCPECGAEVAEGKRFCGECGYRMDE